MKKIFYVLVAIALYMMTTNVMAARYFVKTNGDDLTSGTSWNKSFRTITRAMDAATTTGDEVWIGTGTYIEGMTINVPSGVTVYGGFATTETLISQRDYLSNPTIMDGETSYTCIRNIGILDGFHITGGKTNGNGGGVYSEGLVRNCEIYGNSARYGGGIYSLNGSVSNCAVYDNNASERGGGLYVNHGTADQCMVYRNLSSREGGGIYTSLAVVTNCLAYENKAKYGGGISIYVSDVTNCTVYRNLATSRGGGISNYEGHVKNCIVWINAVSDIENQGTVSYSCYAEAGASDGNINTNPLFMDTAGDSSGWDFRLENGSPCIDAGTAQGAPSRDIEGKTRPGSEGKVCMGAYESPDDFEPGQTVPPIRLYVKPDGDNERDGRSWDDARQTIQGAFDRALDDNTYDIWVSEGIYKEGHTLNVTARTTIYGGFMVGETDISNRNVMSNRSIIDGEGLYSCIENHGVLDSLFITNGYSDSGAAGVINGNILRNCVVFKNRSLRGVGGIINSRGIITNCLVFDNESIASVGGISSDRGKISNCTIYGNSIIGLSQYGTAIKNTIVWNNDMVDLDRSVGAQHCCFGEAWPENGNIRANPLFANTSGESSTWDLRLMNGSPCVDAGIPDDAPATDIRGNERPGVDGKICMGAFESHAGYNMGSPRSPRRYYVKPDGDDAADGGAWDSPLRTIAAALDKVEGDDLCDIWVAEGDYPASPTLIINGRTGLFGGFEGIETIIAQRNIGLFRTTVSGQDSNSCFINNGVLDGLHITRGASAIGGGVTNYGTILNCEVFNNSAALMGGGIVNMGYVGNCKVRDNLVMNSGEWQYTGGGIFNQEGVIKNCEIHGNGTPYSGGGIYNYYGIVENCLVYDNEAISNAGGIDNVYGTVGNSTIAGNMVQDYNGGVSNPYKEGAVTNSIIWGNAVDDMEDPGNARFNCFREAAGENDNISSDPLFINLSGEVPTWDLKLQPDSPCIDRGTSPVASLQDIRGVRRPQGAGIDMGAYEWLAPEAPFMETIEDTSAFGGILFIGPAPRLVQGEAPIAWTLLECPTGMTIDEDTGVVSWSDPTVSPIPYRISIMARNSAGYDIKVWQLNVLSVAGWVLY